MQISDYKKITYRIDALANYLDQPRAYGIDFNAFVEAGTLKKAGVENAEWETREETVTNI